MDRSGGSARVGVDADIDIDIDNITERFFTESDWAELRGFRMAMEMKQS